MAKPAPRNTLIVHFDGTDMSELNTATRQSDDRLAFAGS
jgi:hypothetical protein